MFNKLIQAIKGWLTNDGVPKGVDPNKPFKGERVWGRDTEGNRQEYVYGIDDKNSTIPTEWERNQTPYGTKKLIHPKTNKEVKPLANVYKDPKAYIKVMADAKWGEEQWPFLEELIFRESSWDPMADNGGHAGLFQLNKGLYPLKDMSVPEQWRVGSEYIANRYKTPQAALNFWKNVAPRYLASGKPEYADYSEHWY